jgi:hypothetical protein
VIAPPDELSAGALVADTLGWFVRSVAKETVTGDGAGGNPFLGDTFQVLLRGPQAVGVPKQFAVPIDCHLSQICSAVSISGVWITKEPIGTLGPAQGAFTWVLGLGSGGGTKCDMNAPLKAGESIYVDSIGGMGTSDFILFVFTRTGASDIP